MSYLRTVVNGTTGAGNGPPTLITHGVPLRRNAPGAVPQAGNQGFPDDVDEVGILVEGVGAAAAANSIAFVKAWGWFDLAFGANKWFPLGSAATDAARGKLNDGNAIGEVVATDDFIRFSERIRGLGECSRVYTEYGALTNVTRVDITLVSTSQPRRW